MNKNDSPLVYTYAFGDYFTVLSILWNHSLSCEASLGCLWLDAWLFKVQAIFVKLFFHLNSECVTPYALFYFFAWKHRVLPVMVVIFSDSDL